MARKREWSGIEWKILERNYEAAKMRWWKYINVQPSTLAFWIRTHTYKFVRFVEFPNTLQSRRATRWKPQKRVQLLVGIIGVHPLEFIYFIWCFCVYCYLRLHCDALRFSPISDVVGVVRRMVEVLSTSYSSFMACVSVYPIDGYLSAIRRSFACNVGTDRSRSTMP